MKKAQLTVEFYSFDNIQLEKFDGNSHHSIVLREYVSSLFPRTIGLSRSGLFLSVSKLICTHARLVPFSLPQMSQHHPKYCVNNDGRNVLGENRVTWLRGGVLFCEMRYIASCNIL